MNKIFNILATLCISKMFLDFYGYWLIWPFPSSIRIDIWTGTIIWTLVYISLAFCLIKKYRLAILVLAVFYLHYLWQYRNFGFSPILFFQMGLLAKLEMLVILVSIALCITGIWLTLKDYLNSKKLKKY